MRNFMLTLLMIVGMTTFAQQVEPEVLDWDNPTVKIDDKEYTLIDYKHEDKIHFPLSN